MRFSLESYGDHCIVGFIDPVATPWICFRSAIAYSTTPSGNSCYYTLRLGSDGTAEIAIKELHGTTKEQEMHLIIQSGWELHSLWEDRFGIWFFEPTLEIVQHGYGVDHYLQRFREGRIWVFGNEQG